MSIPRLFKFISWYLYILFSRAYQHIQSSPYNTMFIDVFFCDFLLPLFISCWYCHFITHSAAPTPVRTSCRKAYRPQWTGKPSKRQQFMIHIEACERKRKENDPQCPTDHPELGHWNSCFYFSVIWKLR